MPVQIPPSNDVNALAKAIHKATTAGEALELLPGVHLTKPGVKLTTPIGPKGLVMRGSKPDASGQVARIQRPDFSIGTDPRHVIDDNYGIYLIPAPPGPQELLGLVFHVHPPLSPKGKPFEFAILQRGDIKIGGFELDCNMGNQRLEGVPKHAAAHSFMLGFSGASYPFPDGPGGIQRRVFVAFDSVELSDIKLQRGGFADDVRTEPGFDPHPPGFFRPNVANVNISGIADDPASPRVNGQGNSIRFGGLAQRVTVANCDFDSLILEFDEDWRIFPGPPGLFQESEWHVNRIQARVISFNAKGPVQTLSARDLLARESFTVSSAAGTVVDSRLALRSGDLEYFDLRRFLFEQCAFKLPENAGAVSGLDMRTKRHTTFSAAFRNCSFLAAPGFQSGQLIRTESHSNDATARVTADFENCRYPPDFGTQKFPDTHLAILNQQGDYTFLKADLAAVDIAQAIKAPGAQITDQGARITYHIP